VLSREKQGDEKIGNYKEDPNTKVAVKENLC